MRNLRGDNKGMTVPEILIATAVAGIVFLAGVALQRYVFKQAVGTDQNTEATITNIVSDRALWNDFKDAGPSFNNVTVSDDNGASFYDYFSDTSCVGGDTCSRIVTLSAATRSSLPLVIFDRFFVVDACSTASAPPSIRPSAQLFQPLSLYTATPNADFSQDGTLAYNPSALTTLMQNCSYSSIWNSNNKMPTLYFYSPVPLRPMVASGSNYIVDMTSPSRALSYFGARQSDSTINTVTFGGIINQASPILPPPALIDTLDAFLRAIPAAGGGIPFAAFRSVRGVQYSFLPVLDYPGYPNGTGKLVRTEWNVQTNQWGSPQLIAIPVKSVTFQRDSVSTPVVQINVQYDMRNVK